jgi:alpha-ketoglutarate-dependent taurine dioxygenase
MPLMDTTKAEPLSTSAFYEELIGIDFNQEGPRIRTYSVELDPASLIGSLSVSNVLMSIESSDGAVSHVRDNPAAGTADNSASSRYFFLHTDGKYLQEVPEMVVLHCVDPGTSEIPTVFVDTKDIMDVLQKTDRLDEARGYEFIFRNKGGINFVRPLIEINPVNSESVMNIAVGSPQCHLRPQDDSDRTQREADEFYDLLEAIVEEDVPIASHTWRRNDAVVFDNSRLIHGRGLAEHKSLEISDVQRHLHRIWLSRKQV